MNFPKSSPALRKGYLFAAITVCLWASFVWVSRLAGPSGLNSFDLTALRFGVATVILLPVWWRRRVPLLTAQMLSLAVTGGLGYALLAYTGFRFAPAAHGAVLLSGTLPFFVTLVAWYRLGERPSRVRLFALWVIGGGVASLAAHSLGSLHETWQGDLLMVGGSFVWALYTVLVKQSGKGPWEVTTGVALVSALLYLPVYVVFLPKQLPDAAWSVIVLQGAFHGVLVVVVAMLCFMQAMAQLGPTRLGAVMATVPALAGLGAVPLLGEPFSLWLLGGLVLTSMGAWLGARS